VGVDFLEVSIELEKHFGVRIEPDDIVPAWTAHSNDLTAGEFHDIVCKKCVAFGIKVPRSSWNRVKLAIARALGIRPSSIRKDAWLRRDLQFY
jgi:hypothetical protein